MYQNPPLPPPHIHAHTRIHFLMMPRFVRRRTFSTSYYFGGVGVDFGEHPALSQVVVIQEHFLGIQRSY